MLWGPAVNRGIDRRARVAWLRKTEYMANDLYEPSRKFKSQMDTMATYAQFRAIGTLGVATPVPIVA